MKDSDRRPIIRLSLTRAELALSIGVSTSSIDKMVAEGALPPPRRWHTRKLWIVAEVEAALLDMPIDGDEENDRPLAQQRSTRSKNAYAAFLERKALLNSMSESERLEFETSENREWEDAIIRSKLSARERTVLKQLAGAGVGTKVNFRNVRGGGDAVERLKLRGFAEIDYQIRHSDRHENYWITAAGLAAWRTVEHLPTLQPRKNLRGSPATKNFDTWQTVAR